MKLKVIFNKFNDGEDDLEGNFKAWVYDVICEVNIVESIHYRPDTEDYTQIIPEICLSDLSNLNIIDMQMNKTDLIKMVAEKANKTNKRSSRNN